MARQYIMVQACSRNTIRTAMPNGMNPSNDKTIATRNSLIKSEDLGDSNKKQDCFVS